MGKRAGGRKPKGKTVKDYQRGKAANNHDVEVDGDEDFDGKNSKFEPDGKTISEALEAIDEENETIANIMEAARKKCQAPRAAIKTVRKRLIKDGYHAKELDTVIRKHALEIKISNVDRKLDDGQIVSFREMEAALGKFRGLPLVDAALERAREAEAVH